MAQAPQPRATAHRYRSAATDAPYEESGGGGARASSPGAGGHPTLPRDTPSGRRRGHGSGPAIDENNFGNGGSTHNGCCYYTGWAGGGGGGYYGGGGGGNIEAHLEGGGGGGGAGFAYPGSWAASSQIGVQLGDGKVTIRYYVGACNAACTTCTGPTANECASCDAGLTVVNGACVVATTTTAPPTTTSTTIPIVSTTTTTPTPTTTTTLPSPKCAQPLSSGPTPIASDCLFILRAAVGSETCALVCVCDVNGTSGVTATDALTCLKKAVGQEVLLSCPC